MLNKKSINTIITNRLTIRVVMEKDCNSFFAFCKDNEVCKYLTFNPYKSIKECKITIENMMRSYIQGKDINLSVILNSTNSIIGTISLSFDEKSNEVELGYIFNKEYWGNGYGYESIKSVIEYCNDHLDIKTLVANCIDKNDRSINLLKKLGFELYSIDKNVYFQNKGYYDILKYVKN